MNAPRTTTPAANTQSPTRRPLRFATVDDMLADARTFAAAPRVERLGNWTLGQALNHIAAWIEFPFTGYPAELIIPDEMRANASAVKGTMMNSTMPPGVRLPGLAAGTLATEVVPTATGLARLERAARHLQHGDPFEPTPFPDPVFGSITRHEWTQISLRHAELHLSFHVMRLGVLLPTAAPGSGDEGWEGMYTRSAQP
jgi:hypothetical protein